MSPSQPPKSDPPRSLCSRHRLQSPDDPDGVHREPLRLDQIQCSYSHIIFLEFRPPSNRWAFSVQRLAFGVWRLAFGVWRLGENVLHSSFFGKFDRRKQPREAFAYTVGLLNIKQSWSFVSQPPPNALRSTANGLTSGARNSASTKEVR